LTFLEAFETSGVETVLILVGLLAALGVACWLYELLLTAKAKLKKLEKNYKIQPEQSEPERDDPSITS